jgi:hypothetical protein
MGDYQSIYNSGVEIIGTRIELVFSSLFRSNIILSAVFLLFLKANRKLKELLFKSITASVG